MPNQNNPPGSSKDWYTSTSTPASPRQTPPSNVTRETTGYGTGVGSSAGPGMGPTESSPSSVAASSAIDDEQQRRSDESFSSSTTTSSSSGKSSFDVNQMKDRASKTAKSVYARVSSFVKENPRAAAGIGLAAGALLLRRMTKR